MQIAIFSCQGLGDGLISLVLARNLERAGHRVILFHPFLDGIQDWIPGISIRQFPPRLEDFDQFFLVYEKSMHMMAILMECEKNYADRLTVLNPIATPRNDYPYWEGGKFNGAYPFADNLVQFCEREFGQKASKDIGLVLPEGVVREKYPRRVVIHPTSSRAGKNWSKGKFLQLAGELEKRGFEPAFILTEEEKKSWPEVKGFGFTSLDSMARFVVESGFMVGNDSGIGHLASALGLPTLTICRNQMAADFWRPAWSRGEVIIPPKWIPNLKGMRWRDKKWQMFVPVSKVLGKFLKLSSGNEAGVLSDK